MSKFPWGRVIDYIELDFDGHKFEVVKYHGNKFVDGMRVRGQYEDCISYHSEEINQSFDNIYALTIAMIAYRHLGLNQHYLVSGLVRALCIGQEKVA